MKPTSEGKSIARRIEHLEGKVMPTKLRLFWWDDDGEEELEDYIARMLGEDRQRTGYVVLIGVSGQWVEDQHGKHVWARPPRAAARYEKWGDYAPPEVVSRSRKDQTQ